MSTATATETDTAPAAKPAKKKLPLIIAAVVLLAAAGGGGYWFMGKKHAAKEEVHEKEIAPIYVALDNFTVNLQPEVGDQFLQVAISLKVAGEPVVEKLKVHMPEIRNRLLLLLSGKRASELTPSAGKEQLGKEIMDELNRVLEPGLVKKHAAKAKLPVHPVKDPASEESTKAEPEAGQAAANSPEDGAVAEADADPNAEDGASAEEKTSEPVLPITGVLFTSFIIQ